MRKKLIISSLIILIFTLTIVSSLFFIIINYQYQENEENKLKNNNTTIVNIINNENIKDIPSFIKRNFYNGDIKVTLLDKNRNLVIESKKKEENLGCIYYETKIKQGYIIRSSIDITKASVLDKKYYRYYIYIILFSFLISFLLSSRLSQAMIKPIKDLEFVTSRIAQGEFDIRVRITSEDEIGELGKTFNNMGNKLEDMLKEVKDKQNKLESILKSMDSGVIAVDKEFKIIMINPYAKKLFQIEKDIIGENLKDSIGDFHLETLFKHKKNEYNEITICCPEKKILRVKTANIISKYDLIGTVAVVQDVTDIKKLENMRAQFVANVSHELKTPLTSIKGFAETLKYVDDIETRNKFLKIIDDEAERLTRLINDILVLSDIEKDKKDIVMQSINLNKTIEDVCYLVNKSAIDKNIIISVIGDKIPNIKGVEDLYKQMIINLVDNAIKYTEPKGKVTIGTKLKDNKIILWIEDTGVGMEREHLDRIFERFYRVDKARSRAEGGTGLGLAIVKHIVIGIKGKIDVQSKVGEGSKFIIEIPLKQDML
ncbi:two-component system histidine kinase PnpS [Clostridium niameyense]|uniref:two-component system histidine kinase PnpS n=1 Tax=Clostridium niameyense TaxID=1622073 RepID=UPI00067F658A|nr:HAMP domain-containing sensor histidine kinase [Clostridium niameyense]